MLFINITGQFLRTQISRMLACVLLVLPDSLLVAMVPKIITALRRTKTWLWVTSWHKGSKTPRPSRYTLLLSPHNRDKREKNATSTAMNRGKLIILFITYQNLGRVEGESRHSFLVLRYVYLSQQMSRSHCRPWRRCSPLRSLGGALLWLGFWFQGSELQTDDRKRNMQIVSSCSMFLGSDNTKWHFLRIFLFMLLSCVLSEIQLLQTEHKS